MDGSINRQRPQLSALRELISAVLRQERRIDELERILQKRGVK